MAPDFFFFLNILAIKNTKQGKLHLGEKQVTIATGSESAFVPLSFHSRIYTIAEVPVE